MIGFKQLTLTQFEIYLRARIKNYFLYEYGPILPFFFVNQSYFNSSSGKAFTVEQGTTKAFEDFYFLYEFGIQGDKILDIIQNSGTLPFREVIKFGPFLQYQLAAKYLFDNDLVPKITGTAWENSPYGKNGSKVKESYLVQFFFKEFYLFLKKINISSGDSNFLKQGAYSYLKQTAMSRTNPLWSPAVLDLSTAKAKGKQYDKAQAQFQDSLSAKPTSSDNPNPCCNFLEKTKPLFPNDKPKDSDGDWNEYWTENEADPTSNSSDELIALEGKLTKLRNEAADFNADEEKLLEIIKTMTDSERCYLCKRQPEFHKENPTSMLALLERTFTDGINQRKELGDAVRCSEFGWEDSEGFKDNLANGNEVQPQTFAFEQKTGKCPTQTVGTTTNVENFGTAIQSIVPNNFRTNFRNKVDETNVRIDRALITLIEGV